MKDFALRDLPQAIGLQVPEWVLGPGSARWAKVFQQTAGAFLDAHERYQAIFTALECRQGVQKEQRLVWGPFFTPVPDVDGGEAVEEVLVTGLVGPSCDGSIMVVSGLESCEQQGSKTSVGRFRVIHGPPEEKGGLLRVLPRRCQADLRTNCSGRGGAPRCPHNA